MKSRLSGRVKNAAASRAMVRRMMSKVFMCPDSSSAAETAHLSSYLFIRLFTERGLFAFQSRDCRWGFYRPIPCAESKALAAIDRMPREGRADNPRSLQLGGEPRSDKIEADQH